MRRALLFALLFGGATARADKPRKSADEVDIEGIKSRLVFVHDGHGHYMAMVPFDSDAPVFYGDGKTFYEQRVFSYSHQQVEGKASLSFWAPNSVPRGGEASLASGVWTVRCSDRSTPMVKLDEIETGKLLERAVFKKVMWKRQAHGLARNDEGTYYYVDQLRDPRPLADQVDDPHPPTGFRLFVGRKGKMREQKITDSVVDSKGIVLTTRLGKLAMDESGKRVVLTKGKKRTELIPLDPMDNLRVIYRDLGLYGKLGTPCDAL